MTILINKYSVKGKYCKFDVCSIFKGELPIPIKADASTFDLTEPRFFAVKFQEMSEDSSSVGR